MERQRIASARDPSPPAPFDREVHHDRTSHPPHDPCGARCHRHPDPPGRSIGGRAPTIVVTKDPNCGCCSGWVDHLRAAGFSATVMESPDVNRVKARLGVPEDLASCHTAEVAGYVVEGHVP